MSSSNARRRSRIALVALRCGSTIGSKASQQERCIRYAVQTRTCRGSGRLVKGSICLCILACCPPHNSIVDIERNAIDTPVSASITGVRADREGHIGAEGSVPHQVGSEHTISRRKHAERRRGGVRWDGRWARADRRTKARSLPLFYSFLLRFRTSISKVASRPESHTKNGRA